MHRFAVASSTFIAGVKSMNACVYLLQVLSIALLRSTFGVLNQRVGWACGVLFARGGESWRREAIAAVAEGVESRNSAEMITGMRRLVSGQKPQRIASYQKSAYATVLLQC
jgi:hypothetical protein